MKQTVVEANTRGISLTSTSYKAVFGIHSQIYPPYVDQLTRDFQ